MPFLPLRLDKPNVCFSKLLYQYLYRVYFFQILEDWRYIAMVIDRLQLYIFMAVTIGGTVGILINAPHIFEYVDQDEVKKSIMGK